MPPKHYELGPGQLFIVGTNGDKSVVESISDLPAIDFDVGKDSVHVVIRGACEYTLTGTAKINRNLFLRVILGRSNNWLKMHGYPMVKGRYAGWYN